MKTKMEIPPVVNVVVGSHKVSTQESSVESAAIPANNSLDHRGDDYLPPENQSSMLEPDEDIPRLRNSFVCVDYDNTEFESVCFQEPEQATLGTAHLLEAKSVLISSRSAQDCCGNFPAPTAEVQPDQVVENHPDQMLDLNCECVKADFKNLQSISNGSILNLDSTSTLVFSESVPDSERKVLDLPHIVEYKQSSITFSDYTCPSTANNFVNESSDDGESSQEEEKEEEDFGHHDGDDDDDDDVFLELPHSRDLLINHSLRSTSKDKQKRKSCVSTQVETDHSQSCCGYEAEAETSSKEVS